MQLFLCKYFAYYACLLVSPQTEIPKEIETEEFTFLRKFTKFQQVRYTLLVKHFTGLVRNQTETKFEQTVTGCRTAVVAMWQVKLPREWHEVGSVPVRVRTWLIICSKKKRSRRKTYCAVRCITALSVSAAQLMNHTMPPTIFKFFKSR